MADLLPPVVAVLAANTTEFSAKMLAAKGEMAGVVESTSALGTAGKVGLVGLAAAAGTVTVAAVHMGTEFQTQMTRLYTAAGAPKQAVLDNSDAILSMASSVGQTGTAMAEALYHPISAGLDMATALQVVKYSAEEATISGASLEDTTYSLSSVMKAFNLGADDSEKTMASLNAIVGEGDMRFQDFNQSVKNWAPTAAQMGISINSMGAGLAYLTDRGNSAEVAATRMTMGISMMTTPSKQAATMLEGLGVASSDVKASSAAMTETLKKTGITQNKLAEDLKQPDGLYVALKDLQDGLEKAGVKGTEADSVLAKIFGGGRSDKAIMSLMQNLDGLRDKFGAIEKDSTTSHFEQNWEDAKKTFGFQMQQIKAAAENALTHLGTVLLPKLSEFISTVGQKGGEAIKQFMAGWNDEDTSTMLGKVGSIVHPIVDDLKTSMKEIGKIFGNLADAVGPLVGILAGGFLEAVKDIASFFANTLGPALIHVTQFLKDNKEIVYVLGGAYITYKGIMLLIEIGTKAWAAAQVILNAVLDANPITLIIIAVAALVLGIVELVKHWDQVEKWLRGVWDAFTKWASGIWNDFLNFWKNLWNTVSQWVTDRWNDIWNFIKGIPDWIVGIFKDAGQWLLNAGKNIIGGLWNGIVDAWHWITDLPGKIWHAIVDALSDSGHWLFDVGKRIIEGLWDGIKSAFDWIKQKIDDVVNWIKDAFKAALSILSPSKVMADEVGKYIPMGIAKGMLDHAHLVQDAANQIAHGAVAGGSVAVSGSISAAGDLGGSIAAGGITSGAGSGGGTVVNVIVQGPLLATKAEIKAAVQEAFLHNGMRNVQNGLSFGTT